MSSDDNLNHANSCLKSGNFQEAIIYYFKVIEINQNNSIAYINRGVSYYNLKQYSNAIADFSKAIELDKSKPSAYLNRGVSYKNVQQYNKAIEDYSQAIKLDPFFTLAYSNRGNCYNDLKQYYNAITDLTKAIELDKNFATAYNNRGNAYHNINLYNNAIADYTIAIELDQNFALAYRNRSRSYNNIGHFIKAISDSTKSIELDENDLEALVQRGIAYNGLSQYTNAIVDLTREINLSQSNPFSFNNRGNSYRGLKQFRNAILDYTKAISLDPNYGIAYCNRGNCYNDLKLYENAISDLTKSIEIDQNYSLAYFNRSIVFYNRSLKDSIGAISKSGFKYHNNCYKDLVSCVFLSYNNIIDLVNLKFILEVFEDFPQNVQYILDHFSIDTELLLFNPIDTIIRKNYDVNLILNLINKGEWYTKHEVAKIEAIFKYHIGGCLTSYEMLNNSNELSSNQEYYYWLLSSFEIQVNFKEDFSTGIEDMQKNQSTDLDNYYLGLTYLLSEEKEKAIEYFTKSIKFLFSKILLAYLNEDQHEQVIMITNLNKEILNFKFDPVVLGEKMSFNSYFHYFECKEYIEELKTFKGLIFETNFTSFQSIFKLDEAAKSELSILSYSLDIKKGIDDMLLNFEKNFEPSINVEETKIKIEKTKEQFKNIFNNTERNIQEGKDTENELRAIIESYSVNSIKFYSLLITYYYSCGKIDKGQSFYLTLFLIKKSSDYKDRKFDDAIDETYKTGLDTGKTITGNLPLKIILGLAKSGAPKLLEFLKDEDAFDKSETEYYKFKENLIDYFKSERMRLNNKKFEEKYKLIDYFVDKNKN